MNAVIEKDEFKNERHALDEVTPLSTPYIIYLDPSGACNFKCNFCPCNTVHYMDEERHQIMNWEMFLKIAGQIREFEEQVKVIDLYANGEPLLNKNLCKMARYLKDNQLCREVRFTTNGSLLNAEINQQLVDSGVDLIRISVESLYEEDYLNKCGYKMDYAKYIASIEDLYHRSRGKCKISVKIITAAFKNDGDVQRFKEIYEPISDYRLVQRILDNMWSEFPTVQLDEGGSKYETHENMVQPGWTICAMPLTMMTIHSNGVVGVCPQDWKFGTAYGDVRTGTLKEAWNSEKLREMRLLHLRGKRNEIPYCNGCRCVADDNIDLIASKIEQNILNG